MSIDLVLADAHPVILHGLESLFHPERDLRVIASCADGSSALCAVRKHRPDILVLDLRMPHMDGLAVLRQVREESLTTRVVLFTTSISDDEVLQAFRWDVNGIVLKTMAPHLIVQCVRKVHTGESWLETCSIKRALDTIARQGAATRKVGELLTSREITIAQMVADGLRNRDIADKLFIAEGTVKVHLHNVYHKLDLSGRAELTLYAHESGIVKRREPSPEY